MPTPKHTPEPWHDAGGWIDSADYGPAVADFCVGPWTTEQKHANAARAVQCVNACAGMDDPADKIERWKADERAEADLRADYAARLGLDDPHSCWADILAAAERRGMERAAGMDDPAAKLLALADAYQRFLWARRDFNACRIEHDPYVVQRAQERMAEELDKLLRAVAALTPKEP